jgi:hypothetical protein
VPDNEEKTAKGEDVVIKGAKVEAPVYKVKGGTVLIEERLSELERITKVLENWRKEDKKENRKWRWITIALALIAIIVSIVLKVIS